MTRKADISDHKSQTQNLKSEILNRRPFLPPLLFAHRGASYDAPENTHTAFRLAAQQGADGIECDVYLTRDKRVVCIHDANTTRTTGVNRRVEAATWTDLRALDAGRWKGPRWAGERIPLLADVLAELPRRMGIQVEVKSGPRIVPTLVPLLRKFPAYRRRLTVIAFDPRVVRAIKRAAPDIRVLWLTAYRSIGGPVTPKRLREGGWSPSRDEILETLAATGADGLGSQSHRALTPTLAAALRARNLALCVWTVDRPATARRCARLGVEAIATNRPGWLRAALMP